MKTKDYQDLYEVAENLWWFRGMEKITQVLLDQICADLGQRSILNASYGVCFVRVAAYEKLESGHDAALSTHHRCNLDELKTKLENVGFKVIRTTYANSYLLPVAVVRRLNLEKIGLADQGSDVKPLPPNPAWLNRIFTGILEREAKILQNPTTKLSFGLSAICLARKP